MDRAHRPLRKAIPTAHEQAACQSPCARGAHVAPAVPDHPGPLQIDPEAGAAFEHHARLRFAPGVAASARFVSCGTMPSASDNGVDRRAALSQQLQQARIDRGECVPVIIAPTDARLVGRHDHRNPKVVGKTDKPGRAGEQNHIGRIMNEAGIGNQQVIPVEEQRRQVTPADEFAMCADPAPGAIDQHGASTRPRARGASCSASQAPHK